MGINPSFKKKSQYEICTYSSEDYLPFQNIKNESIIVNYFFWDLRNIPLNVTRGAAENFIILATTAGTLSPCW
jgi:hypothetical protein